MEFLKRLLGIEDQTKLIEEKFNAMQEKIMAEVATLRNENYSLKSEISQKNARITELLGKVRDQNEADLLLEAKKIEKRILEGEKRSDIDTSYLNSLQQLQGQYAQQMAAQRNVGMLGSLGGLSGF